MKPTSLLPAVLVVSLLASVPRSEAALAGLWRFNVTGTSQADSSANSNTATSVNGAAWTYDITRNSGTMFFDGVNDFLQAADSASLSITGNLTIALWVNLSSVGPFGQWRGMVTKDPVGSGTAGPYQFWFNQNDGTPVFVGGNGATNDTATPSAGSGPTTNVWQHWAVTLTGSTVAMYRNGIALPMADSTITAPIADGNGPLFIGDRAGAQDMSFHGRMDDVSIFNQALTQAEIQTIMTGDFSSFGVPVPEPGTALVGLALLGVASGRRRRR